MILLCCSSMTERSEGSICHILLSVAQNGQLKKHILLKRNVRRLRPERVPSLLRLRYRPGTTRLFPDRSNLPALPDHQNFPGPQNRSSGKKYICRPVHVTKFQIHPVDLLVGSQKKTNFGLIGTAQYIQCGLYSHTPGFSQSRGSVTAPSSSKYRVMSASFSHAVFYDRGFHILHMPSQFFAPADDGPRPCWSDYRC